MEILLRSRKYSLFIFIIGTFFISACETSVDIDIPFEKPQVTLNSTFINDTNPKVRLTFTKHILDNNWEFEPISEAEVKLIQENETWYLNYNEESGDYVNSEYFIEEGKEYTIQVLLEGYDMITASELVPIKVPIKEFIYNGQVKRDSWSTNDDVTLIFDDPVGENYYEISAYYYRKDYYTDQYGNEFYFEENYPIYLEPKNPSYENDYNLNGEILIDDNLFEGTEATIDFFTNGNYFEIDNGGEVHFVLKAISPSYYNYGSTFGLQEWNDGDPFAQPVQVYSNIENGIGIFMTGSVSTIKMDTNSGQN